MRYTGQSAAVESTVTFEEESERQFDILTQEPVRNPADAVSALPTWENYVGGSVQISSVPEQEAPHGDYTGHTQDADGRTPVLALPPLPRRVRSAPFHALQEWEGYVLAVDNHEFVARLIDLTAGGNYEGEEATIPIRELSDHDARKLRVGAIFRWVIGHLNTVGARRKRVSRIVFRDLPAVTKSDLQGGEEWAARMAKSLNP